MKWRGREQSSNVEDRRDGGGGRRGGGGRLGIVGTLIVVGISLLLGLNPLEMLGLVNSAVPADRAPRTAPQTAGNDEGKQFVSVVLADTEKVWEDLFSRSGKRYRKPTLVLFDGEVRSACGLADSAVGPFYCPGDQNVYLDLDFFRSLSGRMGAPGDFAQAYVIAHEVGHHVQHQLGVLREVNRAKRRLSKAEANALQVRVELQADFYAGIWAHYAQKRFDILEPGDLREAMGAAAAVGDDRLQKQARGYVVPDSFTHGTSEQRVRWFKKGFETGDIGQGDTFKARSL